MLVIGAEEKRVKEATAARRTDDAALDGEGHGDPERPGLQRERERVDVRHEREVAAVVRDGRHQLPQRQRQERAHEEQRVRARQRREVHVRRVRPHRPALVHNSYR